MNKTTEELQQEIDELKSQVAHLKSCKRYGLEWEDREEEFDHLAKNAFPVLTAKNDDNYPDISSNDSNDQKPHILIEGDNYHTLSVLSYTHKNKVDVIYIDPPYNTGNDFIYNDKLVDKEDSFRHSKWLSFMDKRLRLAKQLLSNNGVIFISIDDNEMAQLKILCGDIFGENNLIGIFTWIRKKKGSNLSKKFRKITEYVIAYKGDGMVTLYGQSAYSEKQVPLLNRMNNIRTLSFPKDKLLVGSGVKDGVLKAGQFGSGELIVELLNDIKIKNGVIISPFKIKGRFRWAQNTVDNELKNGSIFTVSKTVRVNISRYNQSEKFKSPASLISVNDGVGTNEDATEELRGIFFEKDKLPFDYPKPVSLINYLVASATRDNKSSIILDFMAGSGTTGHAVLELNREDGGNRQFILCTNNENNICEEVTYERIKRIMQGYTTPKGKEVKGLNGELKYLKTDFIKKQNNETVTDEDRIKLTYEVGSILALKENTFNEVKKSTYYQIFSSSRQLTAIYFNENKIDLSELVEYLANQDTPCKLYLFSWTKGEYKHEFSEYENITAEDIPEPILDVYKSIGVI